MQIKKPGSGTIVYGCSDDLIEVDGDVRGEISKYGTDDDEKGVLLICSDGTLLEVKYGKADMGIWEVKLVKQGTLFEKIEPCMDEDNEPYSDMAYFKTGLKWIYAALNWEKVQ